MCKLEGTHRVWSHVDDWLRNLANVNDARTKHPRSRRRIVTPPSKCRWVAVLICKMNLLTMWSWPLSLTKSIIYHFEYILRSFIIPSLNTLGSFVFELCCRQTDKQTNRQTNRQHRTFYPRRPTEWTWVTTYLGLHLCKWVVAVVNHILSLLH